MWHTPRTQSTTYQHAWQYFALIVVPIELIITCEVKTLYLLKTPFSKKPKHPE